MDDATPTNWSARPLRRAHLFKSLLGVGAVLVTVLSLWPLIHDNTVARSLIASIVVLAGVRLVMSHRAHEAAHHKKIRSLSRIAGGHWRINADGHVSEGYLQHVWYGWGWVTLRVQPYGQLGALTLTVWRVNVSAPAWHQLRVWTAWELAMVTPPTLTEARQ